MISQKMLVGNDFNGHVGSDMCCFGEVYEEVLRLNK